MQNKYKCPTCERECFDIQLVPNPVVVHILGVDNLQFPRDFICFSCNDIILDIDTPPDYLQDGNDISDYAN